MRIDIQEKILIVGCGKAEDASLIEAIRNEPTWDVIDQCETYFLTLQHVLYHRPHMVIIDLTLSHSNPFQLAAIIMAVSHRTRLLFLCDNPTDDQVSKILSIKAHGLICRNKKPDAVVAEIRIVSTGGISYDQTILMRLIIGSDGIRLGDVIPQQG